MDQKKLLSISTSKVCYFTDKIGKESRRPHYTEEIFYDIFGVMTQWLANSQNKGHYYL